MPEDHELRERVARLEGRLEQWMLAIERRMGVTWRTLVALVSLVASVAAALIVGFLQQGASP